MVDSGYHPLKHHPLRIVLGWWIVGIILMKHHPPRMRAWMVDSGYHPIKLHPLRIVLVWWTVDIILLSIIPLRVVLV